MIAQGRACTSCGAQFEPVRVDQHCCSRDCGIKSSNQRRTAREQAARRRTCVICGEWFDAIRSAQTCSTTCRNQLPEVRARRQAINRRYYANLEPAARLSRTLRAYRLSDTEYRALLASQGGGCAICGSPPEPGSGPSTKRLHVDHDHESGKVRGLLCTRCNPGLGYFGDSPERLRAAADYIEAHA